ncbi:hypothetical protein RUND412_010489 [Rhizina undulata]
MADDSPVASVSSLRSRFEQMSTTPNPQQSIAVSSASEPPQHPQPPQRLKQAFTGTDPFNDHSSRGSGYSSRQSLDISRASLDIPRDNFSGHASTLSRASSVAHRDLDTGSQSATLPRGYGQSFRQRPLSMHSTFSSPRTPPVFKVETPKSPPKPLSIPCRSTSPDRGPLATGLATPLPGPRSFQILSRSTSPSANHRGPPPPPPPPSSRPKPALVTSPKSEHNGISSKRASLAEIPSRWAPASPAGQGLQSYPSNSAASEHAWRPSDSNAPPIPTRATKPKVKPAVPPSISRSEHASSTLAAPVTASSDERVSPFSTPPSSANNSPNRSDTESAPPLPARKPSLQVSRFAPPPVHPSIGEKRDRNALPPPRVSREEVRPRMRFEESVRGQRTSLDDAGLRPDLPPRPPPPGIIGGIKSKVTGSRGRSHSPPREVNAANTEQKSFISFPPPPKRVGTGLEGKSSERPASMFSSDKSLAAFFAGISDVSAAGYGPNDSDEESADDQSGLSDYPDSSQANRRPPLFKPDIPEISCNYDVRNFAVCGQYICTTSHTTSVYIVETGQCIMSLAHGEGTRITAICFKPSAKVQDEGRQLWLGTSHGELLEVDIASQRVVETRTSAHTKREIVQIHRCGYELWSLDDAGKLQVWAPDHQSGVPNLRNSPTTFRIPNRHTFSIVVDRLLWVGAGRTVHIYQPSAEPNIPFNVLTRPLAPSKSTGEITCGAVVNSEPDKVYFGHSDGKVSVYSRSKFTCIDVVSVSLYKITSMSGVGDYLWAGFKTGMMYVYDVRTKPWRVLKDWECAYGPVVQVIADRTSIWKVGRLQVVSMGVDNVIRIWDGMLEDDWLEGEMQKRDIEFCDFREAKALVCTWNCGASKPQDLFVRDEDREFLENVLTSVESPDIIVFGFQELVDLEDKKITANSLGEMVESFLTGGKKKKAADQQEHISHQYRLWQQQLTKSIETYMRDEPYVLLHAANLVGLFTCIFIKASERRNIRNVSATTVKRGLRGLHGNKGALVVRFLLDDSSLCFINCHLAAGQSHTVSRNNDIAAILESNSLPAERSDSGLFVGGGDGSMILDHEICILNGDLNYRIDMHRDSVISKVRNDDLNALLDRDQLLTERRRNPGFRLRAFIESPITFAPTYKYDVGTDTYDSSEKKRVPAWCDRLLYRGIGRIKQTQYRRWEVRTSDHRPVTGGFLIRVKTVNNAKKKVVWERCVERYKEIRDRHVWEAKIDFLVNVCGFGIEKASQSLSDTEGGMIDAVENLQGTY